METPLKIRIETVKMSVLTQYFLLKKTCGTIKPFFRPIWVFPKIRGIPKWMVYNEKPIKMDDLGAPLFLETPILLSSPKIIGFRSTITTAPCCTLHLNRVNGCPSLRFLFVGQWLYRESGSGYPNQIKEPSPNHGLFFMDNLISFFIGFSYACFQK